MASIYEVARIIEKIVKGFNKEVVGCMDDNKDVIRECIQEQLYSGQDGTEHLLSPDYDDDPFFNEEGIWKDRAEQYKKWKKRITPPVRSNLLYLPPRPEEVPNLFITGSFHESITITKKRVRVTITSEGFIDGQSIIKKYGENIFKLGPRARELFIEDILKPRLERYLRECGYK